MTVTLAQLRAAYDALGLEPDQFSNTASVLIEPNGVTVVRYTRDDEGLRYFDPATGQVAKTITIHDLKG